MKKYAFLFLIIVGLQNIQFAQSFEWGEPVKLKRAIKTIHPSSEANFFAVTHRGSDNLGGLGRFQLYGFTNKAFTGQLEKVIRYQEFVNALPVGGHISLFKVHDANDSIVLVRQNFDMAMLAIRSATTVFSYNRKVDYKVSLSDNRKFYAALYVEPSTTDNHVRIIYKVFNEKDEVICDGSYNTTLELKSFQISKVIVSNDGELIVIMKKFESNNLDFAARTGDVKTQHERLTSNAIAVIRLSNGSNNLLQVEHEASKLGEIDAELLSDKNLMLHGLYSKDRVGQRGVFTFVLDLDKNSVVQNNWKDFDFDFLTKTMTEKQRGTVLNNSKADNNLVGLKGFNFKSSTNLPDGSMILVWEQAEYNQSNPGFSPHGIITGNSSLGPSTIGSVPMQETISGNVLVYKISANGDILWQLCILKNQMDSGFHITFGSIMTYFSNDMFYIIYNDYPPGYNPYGKLLGWHDHGDQIITEFTISPFEVAIDPKTGVFNKQQWIFAPQFKGKAMPAYFVNDEVKKEIILVDKIRKKYRFGVMKY